MNNIYTVSLIFTILLIISIGILLLTGIYKKNYLKIIKRSNGFYVNHLYFKNELLKYNTKKLLNKIKGFQITKNDTDYTVHYTKNQFLIITVYSNNKKQSCKVYEVFVSENCLKELFKREIVIKLLNKEELNCQIYYKEQYE